MILAVAFAAFIQTQTPTLQARVEQALLTAPLESIDTVVGHTIVRAALPIDLDHTGDPEVLAVIAPAFRQTPTIIFFRQLPNGGLERVLEGLAPGDLVPVSHTQMDSHVLGVGADMIVGDGTPIDTVKFVQIAMASKMSIVVYRTFMHADMRKGASYFIQESAAALPSGVDGTCQDFEFSPVLDIAIGRLSGGGDTPFVVALTKGTVTLYRLTGLTPAGWLERTSWSRPVTPTITGLKTLPNGMITLAGLGEGDPIQAP
jgi:hypothetical protein